MESGASALENSQTDDGAVDRNALLAANAGLNIAGLLAILHEAVRVRLAVDLQTSPAVRLNTDVGDVDVGILLDEVASKDRSKELRRGDRVLLGGDVNGILDRISGDNNAVIGLGVGGVDLSLKKTADGHFSDGLHTGGGITVNLVDADIVLSVASSGNVRHGGLHVFERGKRYERRIVKAM